MNTHTEAILLELLHEILDELEAIHENTNKPEIFCCPEHGYVPAILSISHTDGEETLSCSVCTRNAP